MSPKDTLYQQLRSHLAYLKLTAAAEALPAALDRATTSHQTHTEFLEQLLAVEVDATEARRLAGRMRFANFPRPLETRRLRLRRPTLHRPRPHP